MKSAAGLVSFAEQALTAGTGYVYGTFGQICTEDLLDRKAAQYPDDDLAGGTMRRVGDKWRGRRVVDCIGLIKYYLWADHYGADPQYNASQDHSANQHYTEAHESGLIGTLPEIPGLLLHMDGHVGIYIGGGYAIEAAGTAEGVIRTRVAGRGWDHWYKSIFLDYSSGSGLAPAGAQFVCDTHGLYQLKSGGQYIMKLSCRAGRPTVVVGSPDVCSVSFHSQHGDDYFYAIHGTSAPGNAAGIYINHSRVSTFVVKIVSSCGCDTSGTLLKKVGQCYTVGLKCQTGRPKVVAGTSGAGPAAVTAAGVFADAKPGYWLAPIVAVRPGVSGIYVQAPNEGGSRRFVVRVAE